MEEPRHLFVYGTLRRGAGHPMADLLSRHITSVAGATVGGRLFDTGRYPAAVESQDARDLIHGELYELDRPDEVWVWLDEYEGYSPGNEADSLFVRRQAMVTPENGRPAPAWVYWYNRPVDEFERIEDGRYG